MVCQEIGADHQLLLFQTELRLFSREKVFLGLMSKKMRERRFLESQGSDYANLFKKEELVSKLA